MDILADYFYMRDYKYCRLDGETDFYERDEEVREFMLQDDDGNYISEHKIFLISTRAGGLGLNLVAADTVILFDSDWNPQCDLQAMDRAHRIGQKLPVNVYRLITKNSIEEKMLEKQIMKLKFDYLIVAKGRAAEYGQEEGKKKDTLENLFNFDITKISKQEHKDLVQFGANKIFGGDDEELDLDNMDLDDIIERGELKVKEQEKLFEDKVKKLTDVEECTFKAKDIRIDCNIYGDIDENAINEAVLAAQKDKAFQLDNENRRNHVYMNAKMAKNLEVYKKETPWTTEDIKELITLKFKPNDFQFLENAERIKELLL